jgi:hypothetical protein
MPVVEAGPFALVHPDDDDGPAHALALAELTVEVPFGPLSGGKGESSTSSAREGDDRNWSTFATRGAGTATFLMARCLIFLGSRLQRGNLCGGNRLG